MYLFHYVFERSACEASLLLGFLADVAFATQALWSEEIKERRGQSRRPAVDFRATSAEGLDGVERVYSE